MILTIPYGTAPQILDLKDYQLQNPSVQSAIQWEAVMGERGISMSPHPTLPWKEGEAMALVW